jgi:hypothetical protein
MFEPSHGLKASSIHLLQRALILAAIGLWIVHVVGFVDALLIHPAHWEVDGESSLFVTVYIGVFRWFIRGMTLGSLSLGVALCLGYASSVPSRRAA